MLADTDSQISLNGKDMSQFVAGWRSPQNTHEIDEKSEIPVTSPSESGSVSIIHQSNPKKSLSEVLWRYPDESMKIGLDTRTEWVPHGALAVEIGEMSYRHL